VVRLIAKLLVIVADQTHASGYTKRCPVAAIALEMSISWSVLREAADEAFATVWGELADALVAKGAARRRARRVAGVVVASREGALLLSKARGDRAPLDDAARVLPHAALSG
jgi:TetR/AcrR family transcriptional repressor of lmrAB and yxaGH operons